MKNPEGPISSYTLGNVMVTGKNQLFGTLTNPAPMKNNAGTINMFMSFFQDGIMRCQLTVDGEERFAISSTGVGVNWEGLT